MSSRQEEKERRKAERMERERADADQAKRRRLAQIVGGTVVAAAIIAGIVFAAAGGGGDGGNASDPDTKAPAGQPIPARRVSDLQQAAKLAGCVVRSFPNEGQDHVTEPSKPSDYKTNPPTSGKHNPVPAQDGVYDEGNEPALENWVHSLEHGRIILMYRPGTPARRVAQLRTLFNEPVAGGPNGYHTLLMRNNTRMPFAVAAVAWRNYIGCKTFDDRTWDALRAFRDQFVDKAPEQVP
jgi:hypothetical protein